jgi:hopene-associated glycosyltransferase HpnB
VNVILLAISFLSLIIWLYLLVFRGGFWLADRRIKIQNIQLKSFPSVCAVIPARNEADLLPITLRSLGKQDYSGSFKIILVDDRSTDGTAEVARKVASEFAGNFPIDIITSQPLVAGWTGKLWALHQGIQYAEKLSSPPDYFLLTDADIERDRSNITELVAKAEAEKLDLVSLMVLLRCESFWEKFLIPAFVFFFQKLYPFSWANNPKNSTAAAAGGCILIKREALDNIGGIEVVRQALIDDCALAKAVKSTNNHSIWLGLTESTRSLRSYPDLNTIWDMVARTAFTQLNYSPLLLVGTVIGMILIYLIPPIALISGLLLGDNSIAITGILTWLLMAVAYFPTIKLYQLSPFWSLSLPGIAFLYTLMTVDSALRHWQGKGGAWKGRVYQG